MKYDATLPIAVFLGPSLDHASARAILPANYYPPVRMGDVYRLLTSGVRTIVLIDGVFHSTTPVWQREILTALDHGITVIGASSMGALRALELGAFGMIGHGTIVDWYRSGRIEGDDEVALQHADAEFGYRALSEPLVNIRYALQQAVEAGVLSAAQSNALIAEMKTLDHARRSYPAVLATAAFAALDVRVQDALKALFRNPPNLKREDAIAVLRWCAGQPVPAGTKSCFDTRRQVTRVEDTLLRGVPAPGGELVLVRDLVEAAAAEHPSWVRAVVRSSARRVFLREWMRHHEVGVPDGVVHRFTREWLSRHEAAPLATFLSANALTEGDLRQELSDRAVEAWLDQRGPAAFGLDKPYLAAWADQAGVEAPSDPTADVSERVLDFGPPFFGFDQWSADVAFARELQVTGYLARLAGNHTSRSYAREGVDADAGAV